MNDCWWRPFHQTERASVIHVDLTPNAARERHAREWLDREEEARWNRFLNPRPQREFCLCRAALRSLLCRQVGCQNGELSFATSRLGKPMAMVDEMQVPIRFNVSHSGQHGLIAISSAGRIGVDLEERITRRDLEGTVGMMLAPGEREAVARLNGKQQIRLLYHLWTMKEALAKALGLGFSLDMTQFEIPTVLRHDRQDTLFQFPHMPEVNWWLTDLSNESFAAALALELESESKEMVRQGLGRNCL